LAPTFDGTRIIYRGLSQTLYRPSVRVCALI
jgi:hypothetical protein